MSTILHHRLENISVRTIEVYGKTYFVGKDAADALGYADATTAIRSHCRGVQILHPIPDALGRLQDTRIIDEPDLMRLIVNSTLPTAERVERWVFEEVLPSIRKTGSYIPAPRTPGEMLLASAQALLAVEQKQAEITANVARLEGQVQDLAESRVWDHCPQNCEPISKIVDRMNKRYALPDWVIHRLMRELPMSPKPHAMVRNHREEARGSQYVVYAVADITRLFAQFVKDCVQETPTLWSHRDIDKRFQLMPDGRKLKPLKAHAKAAMAAA
ncbi:MAG: BRO family protein [Comamonas sp.]